MLAHLPDSGNLLVQGVELLIDLVKLEADCIDETERHCHRVPYAKAVTVPEAELMEVAQESLGC